jgi:hypothetical protein
MDAALAKIGTLVLALQECEQQALGSPAVWTPAGSTKSLTAYIVGGEVTGIPLTCQATTRAGSSGTRPRS